MSRDTKDLNSEDIGTSGPADPDAKVTAGALYALLERQVFPYIDQAAQDAVTRELEKYGGRLEEGGDVYKKLLGAARKAAEEAAERAIENIGERVGAGRGRTQRKEKSAEPTTDFDKLRKDLEEGGEIYTALLEAVGTKYGEDIRNVVEGELRKGGYIRQAITDIAQEVVDRKLKDYKPEDASGRGKGRRGHQEDASHSSDSIPEKGSEAYKQFMDEAREAGREGAREALEELFREGLEDGKIEIRTEDGKDKKLRLGMVLNGLVEKTASINKTVGSVLEFLGYKKAQRKGIEPKDVLSGFENVSEMAAELRKLRKELESQPSKSADSDSSQELDELRRKVEELERRLGEETDERKRKLDKLKREFDFLTGEFEKIGEEGQVFEQGDK